MTILIFKKGEKEEGKKKKKQDQNHPCPFQIPLSYETTAQNIIANNKVEQLSVNCVLDFHSGRITTSSEDPGLLNHSNVRVYNYWVSDRFLFRQASYLKCL